VVLVIAQFTADETGTVVEGGFVATGVRSKGSGEYLSFQRAVPAGGEGDEGVYLEFKDQSNGGYGMVVRCGVSRGRLWVELSGPIDRGGRWDGFEVRLEISDGEWADFVENLGVVFSGCGGVLCVE
jgi:hypothetical protein